MKDKFYVQFDAKIERVDFDLDLLALIGNVYLKNNEGWLSEMTASCDIRHESISKYNFNSNKRFRVTIEEIVGE